MTQMQATAVEASAPDAGQLIAAESSGARFSSLPTHVISFALGDDRLLDIVSFEDRRRGGYEAGDVGMSGNDPIPTHRSHLPG